MIIGTEVIIKKLEEKMIAIKSTIYEGDNQKLTENLISIKAYCDLLLEAQKNTSSLYEPISPKVSLEKKSPEKHKRVFSEKPETDSLFDF
ncbi:MAG: DUF5327 family protein [Anaerobacillus sp.]|uniref:DUF5327 family protein n=1 Tax=Anaerobacillus sp. TaxID=1872506 RepID=UPI00391CC434